MTVTDAYLIGVPIILSLILFEVLISNWFNKDLYKAEDTWCTSGLLLGNVIAAFVIKGAILGFHFFLYQFRIIDLTSIMPIWALWILTFVLITFKFFPNPTTIRFFITAFHIRNYTFKCPLHLIYSASFIIAK